MKARSGEFNKPTKVSQQKENKINFVVSSYSKDKIIEYFEALLPIRI